MNKSTEKVPAEILKGFIMISAICLLGDSLSDALNFVALHSEDKEAKSFFEGLKHRWTNQPTDERPLSPFFDQLADISKEWNILRKATDWGEYGEEEAMALGWRYVIALIVLRRKLAVTKPDSADLQIFHEIGSYFGGDQNMGGSIILGWRKWSSSAQWTEQYIPEILGPNDPGLAGRLELCRKIGVWLQLQEKKPKEESSIPAYFDQEVKTVSELAGNPEAASRAINDVQDFYSVTYLA